VEQKPRLEKIHSIHVRIYENATAALSYGVYTPGRAFPVPHDLGIVDQPARDAFRPAELLVMAAMEWLARDLGEHGDGSL
jgi:hypothetical protein